MKLRAAYAIALVAVACTRQTAVVAVAAAKFLLPVCSDCGNNGSRHASLHTELVAGDGLRSSQLLDDLRYEIGSRGRAYKVRARSRGESFAPEPNYTRIIIEKVVDEAAARNASSKSRRERPSEAPFARVENATNITETTPNGTSVKTVVRVRVRSSAGIACVYLVIFMPVGFLWLLHLYHGFELKDYMKLLAVTFCLCTVGLDMIAQSLAIVSDSPITLTKWQSAVLCGSMGLYSVFSRLLGIETRQVEPHRLLQWLPVSFVFTAHQLLDHMSSEMCSLSEKTIFFNIAPLLAFVVEGIFMPPDLKPDASIRMQIGLWCMAGGALLFGLHSPDFSAQGMFFASLYVVIQIPYRLAQRLFLGSVASGMALPPLVCVDGALLLVLSSFASAVSQEPDLTPIFNHSSIVMMLLISMLMVIGDHFCGLAQLRVGSATMFLVFANIAAILDILVGIFEFGDDNFETPLACAGLVISMASGSWYAIEALWSEKHEEEDLQPTF